MMFIASTEAQPTVRFSELRFEYMLSIYLCICIYPRVEFQCT